MFGICAEAVDSPPNALVWCKPSKLECIEPVYTEEYSCVAVTVWLVTEPCSAYNGCEAPWTWLVLDCMGCAVDASDVDPAIDVTLAVVEYVGPASGGRSGVLMVLCS